MIDVNKITSVLAKLPDAALQQYAEMHKQDPFILPLAIEESNRRKEMRAAPQAMQGQQPHVNDQAVQAMLPEDTGIARLPMQTPIISSNTAHGAHGGIISFAGAGVVPSTGANSEAADTDLLIREQDEMSRGQRTQFSPEAAAAQERLRAARAQRESSYLNEEQQRMLGRGRQAAREAQGFGALQTMPMTPSAAPVALPSASATPTAEYAPNMAADFGTPISAAKSAPAGGAQPRPQPRPDAGLGAIPGVARTPSATGASQEAAPAPMTDEQRIARYAELANKLAPEDKAKPMYDALQKEQEDLARERFEKYHAEKPKGKAHEGLEASLKKEEEALPQKREENLKMALISAGLGMMAGTSQYAMVNIGKGGEEGVRAYEKGRDKLEKAAERRQELAAKIEAARRAEARGDADKAYEFRKDAAGMSAKIRELQIRGVQETMKLGHEGARNFVDNATRLEQQRIAGQTSRDVAAMHERGAEARSNAQIRSQDTSLQRTAITTQMAGLNADLQANARQLAAIPAVMQDAKNPEYVRLIKEQQALTAQRNQLYRQLQTVGRMPATEAPAASTTPAPGSRPPLGSFQGK